MVSVMAATVMSTLDSTIANVALPHIQGSVSAAAGEITWVLTSYIVAAAIVTPLTGWCAARFGRRRLILASIASFTLTSGLCGIATSLSELVGFRLLQGICGAALVPISQAILLDINPPERHGPAMSIWGMGAVLGPIAGPPLGGYLTDNFAWQWVFLINIPIGVLAFLGLSVFLRETKARERVRLDFFGFLMLGLAIGSLQLMLDRGQTKGWFSSAEICIEAACVLLFGCLFAVHTFTARKPFIAPELFADRNFTIGMAMIFITGVLLFSVVSLLPPLLENLMHYPVLLAGMVTAPRGAGSLIGMLVAGRLAGRLDSRLVILIGLLLAAYAAHRMTGFTLQMDQALVASSGFLHGMATGFMFVPLTVMAFGTLDPRFRNDASAIFNLCRNLGASVGIATLQALTLRNSAIVHSRLVEGVRPDNPVLSEAAPWLDFSMPEQLIRMNAEITRQASMVAYSDSFWFLFVITIAAIPLILLMRPPRVTGSGDPAPHME
jgi:MFS transporter, DHA2 family, multidrug resistance protein